MGCCDDLLPYLYLRLPRVRTVARHCPYLTPVLLDLPPDFDFVYCRLCLDVPGHIYTLISYCRWWVDYPLLQHAISGGGHSRNPCAATHLPVVRG